MDKGMETGITGKGKRRKEAFLRQFRETGLLVKSAEAVGVGKSTIYRWQDNDPAFKQAVEDARDYLVEQLEAEAKRRACEGTEKPVFYLGKQCGVIREYSDTLLIVLLKANAPEKYRERYEHTGAGGGPIQHEHIYNLTDEQLAAIAARGSAGIIETPKGEA